MLLLMYSGVLVGAPWPIESRRAILLLQHSGQHLMAHLGRWLPLTRSRW